jgi:hypothetical protein
LDFWFENKPSGNPELRSARKLTIIQKNSFFSFDMETGKAFFKAVKMQKMLHFTVMARLKAHLHLVNKNKLQNDSHKKRQCFLCLSDGDKHICSSV